MEIWKEIKGYEGLYQVSSLGRIKSCEKYVKCKNGKALKKEKILTPKNVNNYHHILLHKNGNYKNFKIHRLVAMAFYENPNNYPQVNHIDGNKLNNRVENLEWCTASHNEIHKYKLGYKNNRRVLQEFQIPLIKEAYKIFCNQRVVAKLFNVSQRTITCVLNNISYTNKHAL